jgi:hypothetical protein
MPAGRDGGELGIQSSQNEKVAVCPESCDSSSKDVLWTAMDAPPRSRNRPKWHLPTPGRIGVARAIVVAMIAAAMEEAGDAGRTFSQLGPKSACPKVLRVISAPRRLGTPVAGGISSISSVSG